METDLFDFAYIPDWYGQLEELEGMVLPEPWQFKRPLHIPDQTCQLHGEFPPGGRRKPATPPEGSASNGLCQP